MAGRSLPDLVARLLLDRSDFQAGVAASVRDVAGLDAATSRGASGLLSLGTAHGHAGERAKAHGEAVNGASLSMHNFELSTSRASRVLGQTGEEFENLSGRVSALAGLQGGLGAASLGAAAGLGAVILALHSAVDIAEQDEKATASLEQAYKTAGLSFSDYRAELDAFLDKNRAYITSQADAKEAKAQLIRAGFGEQQAMSLLSNAIDLAALSGRTLEQTTEDLTSAFIGGRATALIPYGISMKEIQKDHLDAEQSQKDLKKAQEEAIATTKAQEEAAKALGEAIVQSQVEALNKAQQARQRQADEEVRDLQRMMSAQDDETDVRIREQQAILKQIDLQQQLRDEQNQAADDAQTISEDQAQLRDAAFAGDVQAAQKLGQQLERDKRKQANDQARAAEDAQKRQVQGAIDALQEEKRVRDHNYQSRIQQIQDMARADQEATSAQIAHLQEFGAAAIKVDGQLINLKGVDHVADVTQKAADASEKAAAAQDKLTEAQKNARSPQEVTARLQQLINEKSEEGRSRITELQQQQNILNSRWQEFSDKIGPILLNYLTGTVVALNHLVDIGEGAIDVAHRLGDALGNIHGPEDLLKFFQKLIDVANQLHQLPGLGLAIPGNIQGGTTAQGSTTYGTGTTGGTTTSTAPVPHQLNAFGGVLQEPFIGRGVYTGNTQSIMMGEEILARSDPRHSAAPAAPSVTNVYNINVPNYVGNHGELARAIDRRLASVRR